MVTPVEPSWWRNSRIALLSLVVIVPAAVFAALSVDAIDYWESQHRDISTVAKGDTATLGAMTASVVDAWSAEGGTARGEAYGVPEGRVLVSVTIELDPSAAGEEFTGCRIRLLERETDTRWNPSTSGVDYYPGDGLPDEVPLTCSAFDSSYPIEETFVLPADVSDDAIVEVVIASELPRVLHLELR